MKLIPLTKGYAAMVDDEDFEKLSAFTWYALVTPNTCYAITTRKGITMLMHRMIMGVLDKKALIDHKDRNGLNCQKSNLRECTFSQNHHNRKAKYENRKGIERADKKWRARIKVNGRYLDLGRHLTPELAAQAYNVAAIKYHGEFARLNIIAA